jgi:hypothetical protein
VSPDVIAIVGRTRTVVAVPGVHWKGTVPLTPSAEDCRAAFLALAAEVARTLAAMTKIEPFILTDEERAALEADHQARKDRPPTGPTSCGDCGSR